MIIDMRGLGLIAVGVVLAAGAGAASGSSGEKRTLTLRGSSGQSAVLQEMPIAGAVMLSGAVWRDGMVVVRGGTCAVPGPGGAYHPSWGGQIDFRFDVLRRSTFVIEKYVRPGATRPAVCVEHRGRSDLRVPTSQPHRVVIARLVSPTRLEARKTEPFMGLRVVLRAADDGRATLFTLRSDGGGSGGVVAHLRRGTCKKRLNASEIPLSVVWIDSPGTDPPLRVDMPFSEFGRNRWVVELHEDSKGYVVEDCVQV